MFPFFSIQDFRLHLHITTIVVHIHSACTSYSKWEHVQIHVGWQIKMLMERRHFKPLTHTKKLINEDVPLVEFMYLAFACMPGESYSRQLRSLLLYLCYVFWALMNSLGCWLFNTKVSKKSSFYMSFLLFLLIYEPYSVVSWTVLCRLI